MTGAPQPDYDHSVEFLSQWAPEDFWVLVAIHPETRRITAQSFLAKDKADLQEWLKKHGAKKNLYFHVNPTRGPLTKKASTREIEEMSWLHVDVDPRAGEDIQVEQARILRLFNEELPEGQQPPTCVVFSGGGFQGFWRLKEPLHLGGNAEKAEAAKLYNLAIEQAFEADSCHNVDRIMRLPGTINWPDKKKRKKGRTPALAKVVWWAHDVWYDLEEFAPAVIAQAAAPGQQPRAGISSVDDLPPNVSDEIKVVIRCGHDPKKPNRLPSRSEWLWFTVCELIRCGVGEDTIYGIITDPKFKISGSVLEADSPEKYARKQIRDGLEKAINPIIRAMNGKYMVIRSIGGKCRIAHEKAHHHTGQVNLVLQSCSDFLLAIKNQTYSHAQKNGGVVDKPIGPFWLRDKSRRTYDGIIFDPSVNGNVGEEFNLWRGFRYVARQGDCSLFLDHVRENICDGNEEHYGYLIGWMATAVQKPAQPGHTAVVMRGSQGTGKSFFAKMFGALFGRHFLQVSNSAHLVGNFNAHLQDKVVVFGDEAFYAGDKRHESVLKTLVTEDQIIIEAKGIDAYAMQNFIHLIMASNESWVVPAGAHERRYFVLDVNQNHQKDRPYFQAIADQLRAGGNEALLHFLRTYDLSGFDVTTIPMTKGLRDQKELSLGPLASWWLEKLEDGRIYRDIDDWPDFIIIPVVQNDFSLFSRTNNVRWGISSHALTKFTQEHWPRGYEWDLKRHSGVVEMVDANTHQVVHINRPRMRDLPPLKACRTRWEEVHGQHDWPDLEESHEGTVPTKDLPF